MLIASISTAFYIVATDPGMALCAERRRSRVESSENFPGAFMAADTN
jgi:hypothetical protein